MPNPVQAPMMHLRLAFTVEELRSRAIDIARSEGVLTFNRRFALKTVSALAVVTKDQLYLEFPPSGLPSSSCPRPAPEAGKYDRLTGSFRLILADEQSQCASFLASHLSISFDWQTTGAPVVSLPTSGGGALSFLVLDRKVNESSLNGSKLSCPPKPDSCSVFLPSTTGKYSAIVYDEQYMLLIETAPRRSPSAPVSLDLIGSGSSTIAVSGSGPKA